MEAQRRFPLVGVVTPIHDMEMPQSSLSSVSIRASSNRIHLSRCTNQLTLWTAICILSLIIFASFFTNTTNTHPIQAQPQTHSFDKHIDTQFGIEISREFLNVEMAIDDEKQSSGTIEFDVCGGLSNQRISIMMASTIAHYMQRKLILPAVMTDFLKQNRANFDYLFDSTHFINEMALMSPPLQIIKATLDIGKHIPYMMKVHNSMNSPSYYLQLRRDLHNEPRIQLDCAFLSIDLSQDNYATRIAWRVFNALIPSLQLRSDAQKVVQEITLNDKTFTSLHLRLEKEWRDHCEIWQGDNCITEATDIRTFLGKIPSLSVGDSIFLAGGFDFVQIQRELNDFKLFTKETILGDDYLARTYKGERDLLAALDFEICSRSRAFIGNSASSFSALLLTSRYDANMPQYHYNEGVIQLEDFVPSIRKLEWKKYGRFVWVFTYNSKSNVEDHVIHAAVNSALKHTSLIPVCLFSGPPNHVSNWLLTKGVRVMFHELSWSNQIILGENGDSSSTDISPEKWQKIKSSFLRTDIPLLHEDLGDYVLYTEKNVLFLKDIRPADFSKWPKYMACGPKLSPTTFRPCDTGVMLLNTRALSKTLPQFIDFLIQRRFDFDSDAPDEHAINEFYDGHFDELEPKFSWKPYWPQNDQTVVLHFHGLNPTDLATFLRDDKSINPKYDSLLQKCRQDGDCVVSIKQFVDHLV